MRDISAADAERLLYRRQFLLGPRVSRRLPSWPQATVGTGLVVQAHPDLALTQATQRGVNLTLLGDLVDPFRPERDNRGVLEDLAERLGSAHDVLRLTAGLGGRWALLADDGRDTIMTHDPGGLRQVFYCTDRAAGPWCASQADRIAEEVELEVDPAARAEFLDSPYVARDPEYWWPGDRSAYRAVRRLLPNHFLDLRSGTAHRFWPWEPIAPVPAADAVIRAAVLLRALIVAAGRRFPLAVPITAGLDSRTLLAASRALAPSVFFYTLAFPHLGRRHPDLRIPRKLLGTLGLPHATIPCRGHMHGYFADLYRRSASPAHAAAGAFAQSLSARYPHGRVSVTGHAAEITRCGVYHMTGYPSQVTPQTLAAYAGMSDNAFATRQFDRWLEAAGEVERHFGMRVLDLFYWEQRVGSWAAAGEAEWDVVHDRFPPFVCRDLLVTLLGTDVALRAPPTYTLHNDIIRALWPAVLREPVNPERRTVKDGLRRIAAATGTETLAASVLAALRRVVGRPAIGPP